VAVSEGFHQRTFSLSRWVLRLGIILYPSYFILDWFVYPEQKYVMLAIRAAAAACLLALQALFPRLKAACRYPALLLGFFVSSFGISVMCAIGGEGFSSPYYIGVLQILVLSALFAEIGKARYAVAIGVIVAPHFALLLLVPWTLNGLLINVFGIVVFAAVVLFGHNYLYDLVRENAALKGILPICANCKKVRDREGSWRDVDSYITAHAGVELSHGLCPQCMRELYPDLADEVEAAGRDEPARSP
jgi:hypothetical protein